MRRGREGREQEVESNLGCGKLYQLNLHARKKIMTNVQKLSLSFLETKAKRETQF